MVKKSGKKSCSKCQAMTKQGKKCKNAASCILGCYKYCHVHSPGYKEKNVYCTTPKRRS